MNQQHYPGKPRPYLVFYEVWIESRHPQDHKHVDVVLAYDAADALVDVGQRVTFTKWDAQNRSSTELVAVRPPRSAKEHALVNEAESSFKHTPAHGYGVDLTERNL